MIHALEPSSGSSPSVHPHETNLQDNGRDSWKQPEGGANTGINFRHGGWKDTRRRVLAAMHAAMVPEYRILNFTQCGHDAYVMRSTEDPDRYGIQCSKCRDRFCKPCARERAGIVARNLLEQVKDRELRFVTLTLKTMHDELGLELDRLYASFRKLQRRAFWKRHVWGGAALLEVKYNHDTERWHPHLHVLCEGRYMKQSALAGEWKQCTGDSYIVDIRAVRDNSKVASYITKYATDPVDKSIGKSVDLLSQALRAMRKRRTCLTFGSWRQFVLTKQDTEHGWEQIGALATFIARAAEGEAEARDVLCRLWKYDERQSKGGSDNNDDRGPPIEGLSDVPF